MMKKRKIIISVVILTGIVLYGVYRLYFERTPEHLLEWSFNISLKGFDYSVESFDEQWCPNGDGHLLIIITFNELTQKNIEYLKTFSHQELPISQADKRQMGASQIPNKYSYADSGLYIYVPEDPNDDRNFKIFIVDTEKNTAVLYYQIM